MKNDIFFFSDDGYSGISISLGCKSDILVNADYYKDALFRLISKEVLDESLESLKKIDDILDSIDRNLINVDACNGLVLYVGKIIEKTVNGELVIRNFPHTEIGDRYFPFVIVDNSKVYEFYLYIVDCIEGTHCANLFVKTNIACSTWVDCSDNSNFDNGIYSFTLPF